MPITIGSNVASVNAQRRLAEGTKELNSVYERLSSGLRINHAGDDAAGLAISSSLSADRRVFDQGVRNLNDGLSLLSIADSTVQELSNIVTRLQELAEQASNGVYGSTQRVAMDKEAQALSKEYIRVAQSATYNGKSIFTADFGDLRVQGGFGANGGIVSHLGGAIGTGSFEAASELLRAAGAQTIEQTASADLNRDGILDLVVGIDQGSNGDIVVMLGTGNGSFSVSATYSKSGAGLDELTLADLNNDGNLDIVAEGSGSALHVQLGNADGTFRAVTAAGTGGGINAFALADLNGDNKLDLATVSGAGGTMYVQLGTGSGSFGTAVSYAMEATISRDVTFGDINNDGIVDVVTAGTGGGVGVFTVRLGNGDGTFRVNTSYTVDTLTYSVRLGDINADGIADVVTAGASGSVSRLGLGDGTFGSSITYSLGGANTDVTLADLNGDGLLDIVGAGTANAQVRLNTGRGTFGAVTSFSTGASASNRFDFADVNGDGVLDLLGSGDDSSDGLLALRLGTSVHGLGALLPFSLGTQADALQALTLFKQTASRLSAQRGAVGAFQSRISVGLNVLGVASENYAEAAGRIQNADIAEESSRLMQRRIQQNAATAILAQANSQPEVALTLLQEK